MLPTHRLVMHSGPMSGKAFPIEKSEVFIGRDLGNDIVINDPEMSRRHARIFLQGNSYLIEDLGSTNGTTVSGQRLVGPYALRPGDIIIFGENLSMVFETLQPEAAATVASSRAPVARATPPVQPAPQPPPVPSYPPPPSQYARPMDTGEQPGAKKKPSLVLIIVAAVLLFLCLCVAVLFAIDVTDSWCWLFGWLFNIFMPGAC